MMKSTFAVWHLFLGKLEGEGNLLFYFSSHSLHAEKLLNTARRRQKDNMIIERLEKNLADSLEVDKTVYLNSFAGLTLTEVFQNIKSFPRTPDLPTKMKFAGNSISGSLKITNAFDQHFASDFKQDKTLSATRFSKPHNLSRRYVFH